MSFDIGWRYLASRIMKAGFAARVAPGFDVWAEARAIDERIRKARRVSWWPLVVGAPAIAIPRGYFLTIGAATYWLVSLLRARNNADDLRHQLEDDLARREREVKILGERLLVRADEADEEAIGSLFDRWMALRPSVLKPLRLELTSQSDESGESDWLIEGDAVTREELVDLLPESGHTQRSFAGERSASAIDKELAEVNAAAMLSLMWALFAGPSRHRVQVRLMIQPPGGVEPQQWVWLRATINEQRLRSAIASQGSAVDAMKVLGGDVGRVFAGQYSPARTDPNPSGFYALGRLGVSKRLAAPAPVQQIDAPYVLLLTSGNAPTIVSTTAGAEVRIPKRADEHAAAESVASEAAVADSTVAEPAAARPVGAEPHVTQPVATTPASKGAEAAPNDTLAAASAARARHVVEAKVERHIADERARREVARATTISAAVSAALGARVANVPGATGGGSLGVSAGGALGSGAGGASGATVGGTLGSGAGGAAESATVRAAPSATARPSSGATARPSLGSAVSEALRLAARRTSDTTVVRAPAPSDATVSDATVSDATVSDAAVSRATVGGELANNITGTTPGAVDETLLDATESVVAGAMDEIAVAAAHATPELSSAQLSSAQLASAQLASASNAADTIDSTSKQEPKSPDDSAAADLSAPLSEAALAGAHEVFRSIEVALEAPLPSANETTERPRKPRMLRDRMEGSRSGTYSSSSNPAAASPLKLVRDEDFEVPAPTGAPDALSLRPADDAPAATPNELIASAPNDSTTAAGDFRRPDDSPKDFSNVSSTTETASTQERSAPPAIAPPSPAFSAPAPAPPAVVDEPTPPTLVDVSASTPVYAPLVPALRGEHFAATAHEYVEFEGSTSAAWVPFKAEPAGYAAMDAMQLAYYFRWRNALRHGAAIRSDVGYIYTHAYELLHIIGAPNATDAAGQLERLWLAYREHFPQIDDYLVSWAADLLTTEVDQDAAVALIERALFAGARLRDDETMLVVDRYWNKGDYTALPNAAVALLVGDPFLWEGKFYQLHNAGPVGAGWIDRAFRDALAVTDAVVSTTTGRTPRDIAIARHGRTEVGRAAFSGAIYDYGRKSAVLGLITSLPHAAPVATTYRNALRFVDELLRDARGYPIETRTAPLRRELAEALRARFAPPAQSPGSEPGVSAGGQSPGSEPGVRARGQSPGSDPGVRAPTPTAGTSIVPVSLPGALSGLLTASGPTHPAQTAPPPQTERPPAPPPEPPPQEAPPVAAAGGHPTEVTETPTPPAASTPPAAPTPPTSQISDAAQRMIAFFEQPPLPPGSAPTTFNNAVPDDFGPVELEVLRLISREPSNVRRYENPKTLLRELATRHDTTPWLLIHRVNQVARRTPFGNRVIDINSDPPRIHEQARSFVEQLIARMKK